jgi:hypothetical protein
VGCAISAFLLIRQPFIMTDFAMQFCGKALNSRIAVNGKIIFSASRSSLQASKQVASQRREYEYRRIYDLEGRDVALQRRVGNSGRTT